ncbi:glycosyltransferase family 39 protein [Actinoplanes derwentensis]|uniref:glycosyltransferase family 39 protein n=1 Tax=Actinoplanes derwentensis TaxID=113562 RepID=UPI0012FE604A|nr:glycosyltransferase family 39 protein [Actinoplanes derwentensis]
MSKTQTTTRPEAGTAAPPVTPPVRAGRPRPWVALRLTRFLPAGLTGALMLGVGLVHAGRPVLSWDEVTSAEVASRSVPQIVDLIPHLDAVFGFYYLLLHWWTALAGTSETALRLPSIVAMAGAVAVAAELGRRLFTPMTGLVTGLILCMIPNTSRYAAEARSYAFACFFAVLALLLLLEAIQRGQRKRWLWYGLSVLFLGLFHLVALTTLVAHAAFVALHRRSRLPVWAGTVTAALLPLAPIAWFGLHQQDAQLHWVEPLNLRRLHSMPGEIAGSREVVWFLIGMAVLVSWRPLRRLAPVALFAIGPLAVLAVVSVLFSPMWVARYLLVVLAPLAMLAAVALTGGRDGWPRFTVLRVVTALLLLGAIAIPGQRAVRAATAKTGPDYRSAAAVVLDRAAPGDVIVYPARNRSTRAGMDYYLRDRGPAGVAPADPLVRVPSAETGWLIATEHTAAAAHVTGAARIWIVVGDVRPDPLTARPDLRPLLTADYRRSGLWHEKRATVGLYELRP